MTNQLLQTVITLLIVDDSESDRVIYSRYLKSNSEYSYRIIEAETLGNGLELWRSQQPDIALIDLNLPDGNGLEFITEIMEEQGEKSFPVIVLTGHGDENIAVQAMKLGASDYLVKGDMTAKSLSNAILQVLRETRLNRQLRRSQQQQRVISEIALRIRKFTDLNDIANAIVREIRQFINADRAAIYQFNPDMSGVIVAEDVLSPWQPCLNVQIQDTCFQESLGGAYREGKSCVVCDIYTANLQDCHLQLLERFQVRANLVMPILLPNNSETILWGLLIMHQCAAPRVWEESDIQLVQQLSVQLAISIKQAIAYQQIQNELVERKRVEALLLDHQKELEKRNDLLEAASKKLEYTVEELRVSVEHQKEQHRQLEIEQLRYQRLFELTPNGYLVTDSSGNILRVNQVALELLDISHECILAKPLAMFVAPANIDLFNSQLNHQLSPNSTKTTWEITLTSQQGNTFSAEITLTKNINLADDKTQLFWIIRDISDRKRTEQELQKLNHSLEAKVQQRTQELWQVNKLQRAILDSTDYAIISTDLIGFIQTFNAGAENMLGYTMGEVVGKITPEIFFDPQEIADKIAKASTILGEDLDISFESLIYTAHQGLIDEEWTNIRKDGSRFPTSISVAILKDDNDQPIGTLSVRKDISDRKQAESQLKATTKRLSLALKSGAIGCWEWDIQQNIILWDERMYKLYGLTNTSSHPELYDLWKDNIHPDDRNFAETLIQEAIAENKEYDCEFRVIHPDGSIHFIKAYGLSNRDAEGNPISMIGVNFDISDRKQAELQLQAANQELLKVTKLKDEFLANMSHELRTPLNSILGLSEALMDQVFGLLNKQQIMAISAVEASGAHLLSLINDILDLSKISSGIIELDIESISVHNLCQSSLVFIKQQAFQKQLQVVSDIPPEINNIKIDERRIKQVLINLLTNAVKFTPNQGKISLLVAIGSGSKWQGEAIIPQQIKDKNSSMIVFQVVDDGIGIAPKDLQRLFQPFIQLDSSLNRQYEGTGLGLALVKRIVELHGGQVMADSSGKGSCFTVALPYEPLPPRDAKPSLSTISSQSMVMDTDNAIAPMILLAEDNDSNIQTFSSYLTAVNYQVIIAKNGEEAVAMAQSYSPDIILMDIQMPKMDGLEAISQIRSDPKVASIPIIALTALAMEGDRERCLAAGANEYLSKPIKLKQLVTVIKQILSPL